MIIAIGCDFFLGGEIGLSTANIGEVSFFIRRKGATSKVLAY